MNKDQTHFNAVYIVLCFKTWPTFKVVCENDSFFLSHLMYSIRLWGVVLGMTRDRMTVGFTTTSYAIGAYDHHWSCEFESTSWRGVLDTTLYVIKFISVLRQVCAWFSPDIPVSSTNKKNRHDITEILLKVALNTISLTLFIYKNKLAQSY